MRKDLAPGLEGGCDFGTECEVGRGAERENPACLQTISFVADTKRTVLTGRTERP